MLISCALSIEFHIILVIVLMTINVFYISIIYYILLPIFMVHVSFINISSSLFTCAMPVFSKEVDTGKDCTEGIITVRNSDLYMYCMAQMGSW